MYCKECGTKNEKNAKFCTKCGKELTEDSKKVTPVTENSAGSAGGIRKAMKKDAKGRVNGHLIGATAIYLAIIFLISSLLKSQATVVNGAANNVTVSVTSPLAGLIVALISIIFTIGLLTVCFKAIKGEKIEFSEVFLKPFENMKVIGYALLITVIVAAASFVLMIIPVIGWIAFSILYIYYLPVISTFLILLVDSKTNKDISFTEAFKQSLDLVKGNRVEYYGVSFSFIGWLILAMLTCGILFIWLLPYMEFTYVNLYQKWTKEKEFTSTETGISNGAIVGITAGGCGCGCIIVIIFFVAIMSIFAGILGSHINDPQIKSFFDKYSQQKDINETDLEKDINDIFNSYSSNYNS